MLLPTLSLLAPAVIVICVAILSTHGPVSPITDDTITGTVRTATAGQAYRVELAGLWALVWEQERRSHRPEYHANCLLCTESSRAPDMVSRDMEYAGVSPNEAQWQGWISPLGARTSSLALARAYFLEEQATGCTNTAHDTVIFIGDSIISTDRCVLGRAVLWPQKHLWEPCTWVHTADVVWV